MKEIVLRDFSDYEAGQCSDGGKYGFWETYNERPDGNFGVSYKTTSCLDYCDKCGEWHNPDTCQQERRVITNTELEKRIKDFKVLVEKDPEHYSIEEDDDEAYLPF